MNEKCIIVGAGSYGQVYAEYLNKNYDILGFIDDNIDLLHKEIVGIKVLGDFNFLLSHISKDINVFIPIGNNRVRVQLFTRVLELGFKTPNFIHENALIHSTVKVGKAVYILPGSKIMPFTHIEDFVMLSLGVNVAHHVYIKQGCFFSQGSNIGASIKILQNVFCGIGSTIMTGVKEVGSNSVIGAGAVIIRDVPEGATVVGNPGKVIRENNI